MSFAYQFWKRVDARLEEMKIGLNDLAAKSNINYGSMRGWRSKDRTPGAEEIVAIARCLEVSTDCLLLGEEHKEEYNPKIRTIVRYLTTHPEVIEKIIMLFDIDQEKSHSDRLA